MTPGDHRVLSWAFWWEPFWIPKPININYTAIHCNFRFRKILLKYFKHMFHGSKLYRFHIDNIVDQGSQITSPLIISLSKPISGLKPVVRFMRFVSPLDSAIIPARYIWVAGACSLSANDEEIIGHATLAGLTASKSPIIWHIWGLWGSTITFH